MSHLGHCKKHDLLSSQFSQSEVDSIISIPISASHLEDHLVWHFNRSGEYSVKSGYWLAADLFSSHCHDIVYSSFSPMSSFWSKLQGMQCLQK